MQKKYFNGKRTAAVYFFLFLLILLSGCAEIQSNRMNTRTFPVDRLFRSFYRQEGGGEVLGPAISAIFAWDENQCQYTENALMCFNPAILKNNGYFFFPIGAVFSLEKEEFTINHASEVPVFSEFQRFYDLLGGEDVIGKPLTQFRFNLQEKRIEQYFENIGFYRMTDQTSNDIKLLAYGVYACDVKCEFTARVHAAVNLNAETVTMPFWEFITRFKNQQSFGNPIAAPLELQPGLFQQVYENAVLIGNPDLPETIHLLDLPVRLGLRQEQPVPQQYSSEDQMVFYVVNSPNGFHVPKDFDQFIIQHGGRELAGDPICEPYQENENLRQCFQNYCLESNPATRKISMVALGEQYLYGENQVVENFGGIIKTDNVSITVKEKAPYISPNENQELEIQLLQIDNGSPVQNIPGSLTVTLPDGIETVYDIQATNEYGLTIVTIPASKTVSNGDVITYALCMNLVGEAQVCFKNSYLIWEFHG